MLCTVLMSHLCVCSLPPLIPLRLMQWRAGRITMSIWMRAAPCAPAVRVCLWQQMQQPPATGSVVCEYACVCVCRRVYVHPSSLLSLPATVCTVCCWCRECAVCPDGTFSDRVRQCMLLWQRGDSSHPALPFCHRCHRCHHCSVWGLLFVSPTTAFPPFFPLLAHLPSPVSSC